MSIKDALLTFSDAQALTATADSENTIDLGAGEDAWGSTVTAPEFAQGKPMWLNVVVQTVLASAGKAETLTTTLYTGAKTGTITTAALATAAIAEVSLAAGYCILSVPLPMGLSRYLKLTYTVGTGNFTSGAIDAWIGFEPYKAA